MDAKLFTNCQIIIKTSTDRFKHDYGMRGENVKSVVIRDDTITKMLESGDFTVSLIDSPGLSLTLEIIETTGDKKK